MKEMVLVAQGPHGYSAHLLRDCPHVQHMTTVQEVLAQRVVEVWEFPSGIERRVKYKNLPAPRTARPVCVWCQKHSRVTGKHE